MQHLQRARAALAQAFWRLRPTPRPRWPALSPLAKRIERSVHVLDSALPIPGTKLRIGLDPLLGLVLPAAGDALSGLVSVSMLFLAVQYRVPSRVIGVMALNIAVDTAVGSIPFVGDAFDFVWKANERNFDLMMHHRGDVPKRGSLPQLLASGALILLALLCVLAPLALLAWLLLRA
jgi:hypothetical protein